MNVLRSPWILVVAGIVCVVVGISAARPGSARGAGAAQAATATAFRDVRVFDGDAEIERATVVIRDGVIAAVGPDVAIPPGAAVIDGAGRTLLPGLIDSHAHAFGDALERAVVFGVTTELDMFTDHARAAEWRREQQTAGGAPQRADIFSAGTMVTAPKGHGTQFGLPIPTIERAGEADAFVDARLAEGSDYIKIVFEDDRGPAGGRPSIDEATLRAVVAAARRRDALVVVHATSQNAARKALAAGAHGLVHVFADEPPAADVVDLARTSGAFVIPTLSVIESVSGTPGSLPLLDVEALSPYFTPGERAELKATFPPNPRSTFRLSHAVEATRQLHAAGVPILAGSDAPNPGTMHGATLHRELELLTGGGLPAREALRAATSRPAKAFGLADRGRIAPGLRADLLLVAGNPLEDITATRQIAGVWKGGRQVERRKAAEAPNTPTPEATAASATSRAPGAPARSGTPSAAPARGRSLRASAECSRTTPCDGASGRTRCDTCNPSARLVVDMFQAATADGNPKEISREVATPSQLDVADGKPHPDGFEARRSMR